MPLSLNHHDLFRIPNTTDKLSLLQSLLYYKDLTSDLTLALIVIIRAELVEPQKQSASVYRLYAEAIRCLCAQMPEVYEPAVREWQQKRQATTSVPNPPPSPVQGPEKANSEASQASGSEEPGQGAEEQPPEEI